MASDMPLSLRRRLTWLALLVGALLAHALTPEGWMPAASAAGGIQFTLCPGAGPAHVMVQTADGKMHHKPAGKGRAGDHPCTFAGVGLGDATPPVPTVRTPERLDTLAPLIPAAGAIPGRGLAAPPPPATGPPALT